MKASSLLFSGVFALTALACTAAEAPDEAASSEDELRSFKSGELVGDIAYGETKSVDHPATSTYRALSFDAKKGDAIEIRVGAQGFDAIVWLLAPDNRTLARANAFADSREETLTRTITADGRYFIVFRDADYEPARFSIALARTNAPAGTGSCGGAPRYPTTGPIALAESTRVEYTRSCDAYGACGEWVESGRKTLRDSAWYASLLPGGRLKTHFDIGRTSSWSSGVTYECSQYDDLDVTLDASGKGATDIRGSDSCRSCTGAGCTESTTYDRGAPRPADVVVGDGCVSIVERDPAPSTNYGTQRKVAYAATY